MFQKRGVPMTKQGWILNVFAFIIAFVSGIMLVPPAHAADLGYRWLGSTATIKSYATIYDSYVLSALLS